LGFSAFAAEWDDLKVTWSANPFSSWAFDSMPRNSNGALKDFVFKDDQCVQGSKFAGKRYWYKQDPAVMLLFDKNGFIAGIQTSVPKTTLTPSSYLTNHPVVDDGNYWTITAYFVDPTKICTTGRTSQQFDQEGTGTGLWFQNGTNPMTDLIKIPLLEEEIKKTDWKFGHCFYTMGNHYWYNVSREMDCKQFFPNCLMYNKGKLTAFCFAVNAYLTSNRYEHPTPSDAAKFIDPVPDCFFNDPSFTKLSTMHVFMINSPRLSFC